MEEGKRTALLISSSVGTKNGGRGSFNEKGKGEDGPLPRKEKEIPYQGSRFFLGKQKKDTEGGTLEKTTNLRRRGGKRKGRGGESKISGKGKSRGREPEGRLATSGKKKRKFTRASSRDSDRTVLLGSDAGGDRNWRCSCTGKKRTGG